MTTLTVDSERCPHCGKIMIADIEQIDAEVVTPLERRECWDCGFRELVWHRPKTGVLDGTTLMEQIRDKVRAG